MIVVFADDFTGAAEIAATARCHGVGVEVRTGCVTIAQNSAVEQAEVIVLDTATRSLEPSHAAARLSQLARSVKAWQPAAIYKKIDSVMRGPIAAEVQALLNVFGWSGALVCPANPGRGRVVRTGQIEIDGIPLNQTEFANDPEHPAKSAGVIELLNSAHPRVRVVDPRNRLNPREWSLANAITAQDLQAYASALPPGILPAGGAEFFAALLQERAGRGVAPQNAPAELPRPILIACGSTAGWESRLEFCRQKKIPIVDIGNLDRVTSGERIQMVAVSQVRTALCVRGAALIAIGQERCSLEQLKRCQQIFIRSLNQVLQTNGADVSLGALIIEGGRTASALMEQQGWNRFQAIDCIDASLVSLHPFTAAAPLVMAKPGSYRWHNVLQRLV